MEAFRPWILLLGTVFLLHICCRGIALSTIEPCSSSGSCQAFVAYRPPNNLRVKNIAALFGIDTAIFLGANDFDLTLPDLENVVVPAKKLLKIPQTCSCVDGIRKGSSTIYVVRPNDTLSVIADDYYAGLVSYQQIATANNITDVNLILIGQKFVIPFPCACHNNSDQGVPAYFLSYPVQPRDSLSAIAANYSTTLADLMSINSIANASTLQAGDVIFVPVHVCSSNFDQGTLDYGLAVAKGSYVITAGTCVQCSCGNDTLYCAPTPVSFSGSCSTMNCPDTNLTLGGYIAKNGTSGCTVTSCVYHGYTKTAILTRSQMAVDPTCPAPPPPPSLYKPPTGLAASPLSAPSVAGGPTSPSSSPSQHLLPEETSPGPGGPQPNSTAPGSAKWSPLLSSLGLCLPLLMWAGA